MSVFADLKEIDQVLHRGIESGQISELKHPMCECGTERANYEAWEKGHYSYSMGEQVMEGKYLCYTCAYEYLKGQK